MIFILLALAIGPTTQAGTVGKILSPTTIALDSAGENWAEGDPLLVFNAEGDPLAYLRVSRGSIPHYEAEIEAWLSPMIILPGQKVETQELWGKPKLKGRTELLQKHAQPGHRVSARYKRLLITNAQSLSQSAAPLDKGEHYVSIVTDYTYGITDRLSIGTIVLGDIARLYNIRAKYNLLASGTMTLSGGIQYLRYEAFQSTIGTVYLDSIANRNLITHFSVSLAYSRTGKIHDHEYGPLRISSSVDASSEYILPNWDRIVIGPQYFLDSQHLGGFFNYVFIWDRTHFVVGVNSKDVLAIKDTSLALMLYWRL